ncbi:MAG: hypothetical protein HFJ43_04205 [Clostridia bacterium]|nr:hypothetical protein [Clostridia bacterium]
MIDVDTFLKEAEDNTKDVFNNLSYNNIFNELITGKFKISSIFSGITDLVKLEFKGILKIITTILLIVIIHSIFKSVSENLGNNSVGRIAYFIQYIIIVIFLMQTYSEVITYIKQTMERLIDYTSLLLPLLITLSASTGNVISSSMIEPIILFSITFIGRFISYILIPILLIGTVFSIISNLSDEVNISKLSKYMKSSIVWILGFTLTIFTAVLSLQSVVSKSSDEVAIKATKNIVSSAIPVVRKSFK